MDRRPALTPNALYMLRFRYLQPLPDGGLEEPVDLFRRVARTLASAEGSDREEWEERFFAVMTDLEFLPNAPALLGAGSRQGQMHACFVLPIADSVDGIFDTLRMAAIVHSKGGGTGFDFSPLRGRGAQIATGGTSTGVVSFMRLFDAETEVIKQGGTGWGANMGVLRFDHPDVEEFVRAKADGAGLRNFNLSVAVTDEFMARAARGEREPVRLLELVAGQAWATGDPGLLFADRIERDNPVPALGALRATNPCGEAPLLPFEACCLGGLNVARFADPASRSFRWAALREVAAVAVRMLDDVIETSRYPLEQVARATRATRKVGIGVMGFADALIALGIPYDTPEAERLATELSGQIAEATREASASLAAERGSFPAFALSVWPDRGVPALRNATTTSNAPNSTIGAIAGCSAGIEPLFALGYEKRLASGDVLRELHPGFLEVAQQRGFHSDELVDEVLARGGVRDCAAVPEDVRRLFVTAHDVEPAWHVRIQAAFQRHTDLGISKTINLPHDAEPGDVRDAFLLAHELGCKGVTVFRDRCLDDQFLSVAACEVCA